MTTGVRDQGGSPVVAVACESGAAGHRLCDGGCVLLVTLFGDRRSDEIVLGVEVGVEGAVGLPRVDVMSVEPRELSMLSRPTRRGRSRH